MLEELSKTPPSVGTVEAFSGSAGDVARGE